MDLLKNLLVRLSDSFFASVPVGLRKTTGKRHGPSLKLVSHNPNPVVSPDLAPGRLLHSTVGHAEILEDALHRSETWGLGHQDSEKGYWVYELEADTTLTSEYLMLRRFLGLVDADREEKAVRYLQQTQLVDGGWPIYTDGPASVSASVKAYFALKLAGVSREEPFMRHARDTILSKGGVV
ncbi:MAG: squalene--hopene cyclase, partial [Nitrospirae bacterium]|nr:squalene--hopene cyclase [Nitrospirota bacterium]